MAHAYPKVLYFIAGTTPSPEQIADADNCGPGVAFRNATLIHAEGPIEDADAVAGSDIPANYAAALPNITDREAVKANMLKRNPILAEKLGGAITNAAPTGETDAQRDARIANAKSRGARPAAVNERNADPTLPSARTAQSGGPRITHAAPNDGWGTKAETLNDAADKGEGVGDTGGGGASGPATGAATGKGKAGKAK
jgi:hypothetical protein